MIDISAKISNALPVVKMTDEIIVTVNNRKSNILKMQSFIKKQEKQAKKADGEFDEISFMNSVLSMLIGEGKARDIEELDLPLPSYKVVYEEILAAATGQAPEDAQFRKK